MKETASQSNDEHSEMFQGGWWVASGAPPPEWLSSSHPQASGAADWAKEKILAPSPLPHPIQSSPVQYNPTFLGQGHGVLPLDRR